MTKAEGTLINISSTTGMRYNCEQFVCMVETVTVIHAAVRNELPENRLRLGTHII